MTKFPWQLAQEHNKKPKVVTARKVTEQELRMKPYKSVIFF